MHLVAVVSHIGVYGRVSLGVWGDSGVYGGLGFIIAHHLQTGMATRDGEPRLEAWLDTDGENDQLHIRVTEDGQEYEAHDVDLDTLLQMEQYVAALDQPALTLLSLYERRVTTSDETEPTDVEVEA